MGYGAGHGYGWVWLFGGLLVVGLVLLTVVAVRIVRGGVRAGSSSRHDLAPGAGRPSAGRLLDERYARGEVSTEEYRERRRVLDESP